MLLLSLALGLAILSAGFLFVRSYIKSLKKRISQLEKKSEESGIQLDQAEREKGRASATLDSLVEGVLVVGPNQTILMVNSALMHDFDLGTQEVRGRYFWELFRDSDLNQLIEKCLKDQIAMKKEHTVLLSGLIFEIQASPVFGGADFLGTALVFHNVTRLKELERLRSEFVANVSHELKTPLTSILGFVETLKEGAADDPQHRTQFLDIIEGHAKKLHRLIEDLLLLSKVETGTEMLKKEKADLGRMLEKISELLSPAMKERKIAFSFELTPKEFFLNVQPTLFSQALSNLVENAVKYNKDGGKIGVHAFYDLEEVRIQVSDTGIGIADSDKPRIFERFYRAERSRSRETGGAGLGLAISKHIIERHGGRIEVESEPQKGSKFTLILPGARV